MQPQALTVIFKGYCRSSRINCGIAKSLAQARACKGFLASDLAIPQVILEQVQLPYYYIPATSLLEYYT